MKATIGFTELIYWMIALAVYLFPSIVAARRDHHQYLAIAVLNVSIFGIAALAVFLVSNTGERELLGLTVLGWIAALVWACTAVQQKPAA
jgi:hypothetical protein